MTDTGPARPAEGSAGACGTGELTVWAEGLGLEAEDLDDLIHDAFSAQAAQINNDGLGPRSGS